MFYFAFVVIISIRIGTFVDFLLYFQTLRIHKCLTQKRVIAEVAGLSTEGGFMGQKFSIPLDIECKFRVVKGCKYTFVFLFYDR